MQQEMLLGKYNITWWYLDRADASHLDQLGTSDQADHLVKRII
jgi:hypothetical protein